MTLMQAVWLGVIQGLTEFLPISSDGHLSLGREVLGIPEPDLLFDIVLHLGTLAAVVTVYRAELATIFRGLWGSLQALRRGEGVAGALSPVGARLALLIVVATFPTGVIGLLLEDAVSGPLATPVVVGGFLLLNAAILASNWVTSRRPDPTPQEPTGGGVMERSALWGITPLKALAIGVAQGVAVLPGVSRSGCTITLSLWLGVPREHAARYSFLLSLPAILGALVLKMDPKLWQEADPDRLTRYGLGAVVSGVVGFAALKLLIRLLRQARFHHFAWYCALVGLVAIAWGLTRG